MSESEEAIPIENSTLCHLRQIVASGYIFYTIRNYDNHMTFRSGTKYIFYQIKRIIIYPVFATERPNGSARCRRIFFLSGA